MKLRIMGRAFIGLVFIGCVIGSVLPLDAGAAPVARKDWADVLPDWAEGVARGAVDKCLAIPAFITGEANHGNIVSAGTSPGSPFKSYEIPTGANETRWVNQDQWLQWKEGVRAITKDLTIPAIGVGAVGTTGAIIEASVVAVDGVAVATAGTAGLVTAGGVLMAAGTVGLVVAVSGGAVCTGLNLGQFLAGGPALELPPGSLAQPFNASGLRTCQGIPATKRGDVCVTSFWPTTLDGWKAGMYSTGIVTGDPNHVGEYGVRSAQASRSALGGDIPIYNAEQSSQWENFFRPIAGGLHTTVLPCFDRSNDCGIVPIGGRDINGNAESVNGMVPFSAILTRPNSSSAWLPNMGYVDYGLQSQGPRLRLSKDVTCKRPSDGNTVTLIGSSPVFRTAFAPPEWGGPKCSTGYAPTRVRIWREQLVGGAQSQAVWVHDGSLFSWDAPSATVNNPFALGCLVVGATNCSVVDNGNGTTTVGGTGGVTGPSSSPDAVELMTEIFENADFPAAEPTESTEAEVNKNPGLNEVDPELCDISCAGEGTGNAENDPTSCFAGGWSWNPVDWVLTPVKCAFEWAFVPSGEGWDDVTGELDTLSESPPLSWAVDAKDFLVGSGATFVQWRDADLPCFTVGETTYCFSSLDGADFPGFIKVAFMVGLWILLAYSVVRFL